MKVKEESEKVGLKLNIKKIKIMAFGSITSWQIDGEKVVAKQADVSALPRITSPISCRPSGAPAALEC